jgi:cytochrome c oxidase cbb3-type subunit III
LISIAVVVFLFAADPFPVMAQAGQQLFESTCAGCHGLDGKGGEHAPDIASNAKLQNLPNSKLFQIIHDGIPASGMPVFGPVFKESQLNAIISYLRTLQGTQKAALISGDEKAGRILFFGKARCAECHMINGEGGFIGTDLTNYGSTHPIDELRQQIRNHNEAGRQGWTRVVTRNGREYLGIARNEDNFSLQLQTFDGDFVFLGKTELAVVERAERSMMPANDGAKLSPRDLDNLISYIGNRKRQRD